jgi:hypothetical protein
MGEERVCMCPKPSGRERGSREWITNERRVGLTAHHPLQELSCISAPCQRAETTDGGVLAWSSSRALRRVRSYTMATGPSKWLDLGRCQIVST